MLRRIKKKPITFSASIEISKLSRSCPSSATLYASSNNTKHKLGRATFLRKNRKLYTIGSKVYIIPDKQLKYKANSNLEGLIISLRFSGKTCLYSIECKVIDKIEFRSKAEDYNGLQQYAFALVPVGKLTIIDRRHFVRYCHSQDKRNREAFIPQVNFDIYLNKTNSQFPIGQSQLTHLNKLEVLDHYNRPPEKFYASKAYKTVRDAFIKKDPAEHFIFASKILQSASNDNKNHVGSHEVKLGRMNLLGINTEFFHKNLILRQSSKAYIFSSIYGDKPNPYKLVLGEIISVEYDHNGRYYQMLAQVLETGRIKQVLRPLGSPIQQNGLKLKLINYSTGGVFIEGDDELKQLLSSTNNLPNFDLNGTQPLDFDEMEIRQAVGQHVFHLTFYPRLKFPKSLHRFEPELPFKICLLAQITGGRFSKNDHEETLQLNIQFCYEQDNNDSWRYIRNLKSNTHFKHISQQIRSLISYIDDYKL
jgi:hypothetical protein